MRDSLQLVSDAIAAMSLNGGAAVEQDPDLQAELDKLMDEQQDIDVIAVKEQVGGQQEALRRCGASRGVSALVFHIASLVRLQQHRLSRQMS